MRLRPPREDQFTSHLRSPAVAARVGLPLGICFGIAFVTGLISHWAQDPHPWFVIPPAPSWGYRLTQGLHIASGTAAIPLLLIKLWAVFPRLFAPVPPLRLRRLVGALLERGSIAVLVAASIFMLASGLANSAQWYPWSFHFRATHYAVAWIAVGALLVHVAVKLPVIRTVLGTAIEDDVADRPETAGPGSGLSRRGLVRTAWGAGAFAVLGTAGGTVPLLRHVSVFAPRSGSGPEGIPINKSAHAAGVLATATASDYTLTLAGPHGELRLRAAELLRLGAHEAELPIACVEGWSASGRWTGVRLRDLVALVGAKPHSEVRVTSLQQHGPYRVTLLPAAYVAHPDTLLATHLNGERLSIDHGFPCRIIAPNRPGVLQTKWVSRLEVTT